MSKKIGLIYRLYLFAVPLTALSAIVLRTIALLSGYDSAAGYFASPTLPTILWILLLGVTATLAVLAYELRPLSIPTIDYRDLPTLFSGIFLSISLVFFAILSFLAVLKLDISPLTAADGRIQLASLIAPILGILIVLAALAGAVPFVLRAFRGETFAIPVAMLTLPMAALGVLMTLYFYFDSTMKMNEPNKLLAEAVWILTVFFFLGESRIALSRTKWALHTCITSLTVIFTAALAFPNLLYHAVKGAPLLGSTIHDFVMLGIFLYAVARFIAAYTAAARSTSPELVYATDFAGAAADAIPTDTTKTDEDPMEEISDEEASDR